jgi:hypothetical protein
MGSASDLLANCGEDRESRRVNPASLCAVAIETVPTLSTERICAAVAQVVEDPDAPLSAWPDRLPGRWATAALVAQITGERSSTATNRLRELVECGAVRVEHVWPGSVRAYQLAPSSDMVKLPGAPLSGPPDPRRRVIYTIQRWAASNGGLAPTKRDWSRARDPDHHWPRAATVSQMFVLEAIEAGVRWFEPERCKKCTCVTDRRYIDHTGQEACTGCWECQGRCPRGRKGQWHGPSGWQYALQLAGLDVRTAADSQATAAQTLGRNRQMVTAGAADIHPQYFES